MGKSVPMTILHFKLVVVSNYSLSFLWTKGEFSASTLTRVMNKHLVFRSFSRHQNQHDLSHV